MDIKRARELLGKKGEKMTDKQIIAVENQLRVLADIVIDKVISTTPKERKAFNKKVKNQEQEVFFIHHSDHYENYLVGKTIDQPKFYWFTDRYFDQLTFGNYSAYKYLFFFVRKLEDNKINLFFRGYINLEDALNRFSKFKKWAENKIEEVKNESFYEEPPILLSSSKIEPNLIAKYNEKAKDFFIIYPAKYKGEKLNLFNPSGFAKNFLDTRLLDLIPQIKKAFPFI